MSSTQQVSVNQALMQLLSMDQATMADAEAGADSAKGTFSAALMEMLGLQSVKAGALQDGLLLPAASAKGGELLPLEGELAAELDPDLLAALEQRLSEFISALSSGAHGEPLTEAQLAELPLDELQQRIADFFELDSASSEQLEKAAEVIQRLLAERQQDRTDTAAQITALLPTDRASATVAGTEDAAALRSAEQPVTAAAASANAGVATAGSAVVGGAVKEVVQQAVAALPDDAVPATTGQRVADAVAQVVQELRRTAADIAAQQQQNMDTRTAQTSAEQQQQRVVETEVQRVQQLAARLDRIDTTALPREVTAELQGRLANSGQSGQSGQVSQGAALAAAVTGASGLAGGGESGSGDNNQRNQSGTSAFQQLQQAYRGGSPTSVTLNLAESFGSERWTSGVSQRVVWMSNQQVGRAELRLDPPDLGSLNIRLSIQNDQASLSFSSPHAHVREALEQQMPRLREMLADKGIDLQQSDVSDQSAGNSSDQQHSSNGRNSAVAESMAAEDDMEHSASLPLGGTSLSMVDYYA